LTSARISRNSQQNSFCLVQRNDKMLIHIFDISSI
jgi:hypothetical protein